MASRRSNRSTSSRPSPRMRAGGQGRRPQKGNKAAPAILAVLVLGGIVLAFSFLGKNRNKSQPSRSDSTPPRTEGRKSPPPEDAGSSTRKGTSAHRPPRLSPEDSLECDRLYEEAKKAWNDALRIKDKDRSQFVENRKLAMRRIEQLMDKVRPILDWEEEATMNDWPIPYEVNDLMRRFNKWSKLQATVHRMSALKK